MFNYFLRFLINKPEQQNKKLMKDIQENNPNYWIFNKLELVNSIIDFCKKNRNNYIDYSHKDQIMSLIDRLNPKTSDLHYNNTILDPLHYVEAEKKIVKFINSEYRLFKVKLPINITKMDVYSIVEDFKDRRYSDILLVYKDAILEKDETSIDFISDDDTFIIIENRIYPNDSYYNSLINQNINEKMYKIQIRIVNLDKELFLSFPSNIPISEMKKAIELKLGYLNILFSGRKIRGDDIIIKNLFKSSNNNCPYNLRVYIPKGNYLSFIKYGKKVLVNAIDKNTKENYIEEIGLLNSNKFLIKIIVEHHLVGYEVKKAYFNGKEISLDKEKSLNSYGIKDNFICEVETIPKNNS